MTGPAPILAESAVGPGAPGAAAAGSAAPGPGGPGAAGTGSAGPAARPPRSPLRRWRAPITVLALVLLGGIVIALLTPSRPTTGYLDPGNPGPQGTRALADLLAQRGQPVIRADSVAAAQDATQAGRTPARPGRPPELVITSPYLLSPGQLGELARLPGNVMVVEPDSAALTALNDRAGGTAGGTVRRTGVAPTVTVVGADAVRPVRPGCTLAAATAAGDAALGGVLLRVSGASGRECYRVDGRPTLVRYRAGGRTVILLGSGAALTNAALARRGNAALALNLLLGSPRIVWLVPSPAAVTAGQKSLFQEIPGPAYLVTLQLFIGAGLAALWRTRRLGPLVAEPLPVVVRASETVEGHGRLYRSRRSRGRAGEVLRDAARHRIVARIALPGDAAADAVSAAVAALAGREPGEVRAILYGPPPRDDAALVALGQDIDALEGEVRTQ